MLVLGLRRLWAFLLFFLISAWVIKVLHEFWIQAEEWIRVEHSHQVYMWHVRTVAEVLRNLRTWLWLRLLNGMIISGAVEMALLTTSVGTLLKLVIRRASWGHQGRSELVIQSGPGRLERGLELVIRLRNQILLSIFGVLPCLGLSVILAFPSIL
jgi:hypothetical protein